MKIQSVVVLFTLPFMLYASLCAQPYTWYTADPHMHAHGCQGNTTPANILNTMKARDINVASVLVWGGSKSQDGGYFQGHVDDPISEPNRIVHWDIEISGMAGAWNGHMLLLNVGQKDAIQKYPGKDYHIPNYDYIHSGGGVLGYAHASQWIANDFKSNPEPGGNYFGPRELTMDAVLTDGSMDFMGTETMNQGFFWMWYSMLDAGIHLPPVMGSDYPCLNPQIGDKLTAFPLPQGEVLTYAKYTEAIRQGRTVILNHKSVRDFLDIRVNGTGLGGELTVPSGTNSVNVEVDASGTGASTTLELLLNGQVNQTTSINSTVTTYSFTVPITKSSWIAARTKDAHTAATFVLLDGCPIRNDAATARKWKGYLDDFYRVGSSLGKFGSSSLVVKTRVEEAKAIWETIAKEAEGSAAPNCGSSGSGQVLFYADKLQGVPPLTATFNNTSVGNYSSWLWDFGDGQTSTNMSPSHTYNNVGKYTVKVTGSGGSSGTKTFTRTDYISVTDPNVTPIVLEAETMNLNGYMIDSGQHLQGSGILVDPNGSGTGTATTTFTGASGIYTIEFHAIPEHDGTPSVKLYINNTVVLDKVYPTDQGWFNLTYREKYTITGVTINNGDVLKIEGTSNGAAFARVDKLILTCMSCAGSGIFFVDRSQTSSHFANISLYPKPMTERTVFDISQIENKTSVRVAIYDNEGTLIQHLAGAPKENTITWVGRNSLGLRVKPGMYFYKITVDGMNHYGKIMYVR